MRSYVEVCLQNMTGLKPLKWHQELELFIGSMETRYKNCGFQAIPQEHMPLIMLEIERRKIPLVAPPKEDKAPPFRKVLPAGV